MKTLLSMALLVTALPVSAAIYYIDRSLGSDNNSGLSPAGAWKTLNRIQSQTLAPGDYVLLKRGEIWGERLAISASGLPDAPITFGAYGEGPRPLLDGSRIPVRDVDVVSITGSNIVVSGLEIRNSARSGVNAYRSARVTLRDLLVAANRFNGVLAYDCNAVLIEDSEISGNGLETSTAYDGIRVDGSGAEIAGFRLRNNSIHHNIGGEDWNSANGIFLGHTGLNVPTLRGVRITGNDIYANGNPNQNQAGRGVSGVLNGDVTISGNYIYRNASAGIYLGDRQFNLDLNFTNNVFVNNALRQFGGFTNTFAHAEHNLMMSDDASITAMGIEIGGEGRWEIVNNVFAYPTATDDSWRAFIRLNDATLEHTLSSDWNLFYSAGPNRWKLANGIPIDFGNWQAAGFDKHSRSTK